jgi:hypothetical protein
MTFVDIVFLFPTDTAPAVADMNYGKSGPLIPYLVLMFFSSASHSGNGSSYDRKFDMVLAPQGTHLVHHTHTISKL